MKALTDTQIIDEFWNRYTELVRTAVIPYQWEALNDRIPGAEPSRAVKNFKVAAGLEEGEFYGFVFQDTDVAKWLEAVGYSLANHPDPELESIADGIIDIIAAAQHENGYLNTYFTIKEPGKQWTNLQDCHELYTAGHMMEAAVAYFKSTGKRKLLDVVIRFADHIDSIFGREPGKLRGYDGHQEIELALVKLYEATGELRYLRLSRFFIDERGQEPNYLVEEWEKRNRISHWTGRPGGMNLAYHQAHEPVREQKVAVGHAVRAVYMYAAMADLAKLDGDPSLREACERLWANVTQKQMYITGGIGSTHHGEAFTFDYDLPNDTVYAETCASIGLIFFAQRMLRIEAKSEYADVMERALYNNVIGSMSADGKHYFYVNPLEVWPEASEKNPGRHHVKAVRQPWFGCSCCPPNVARLLCSLNQYIYTADTESRTIYTHLYIGSETEYTLGSDRVTLKQRSELPWSGKADIRVRLEAPGTFRLAFRIPGWVTAEPAIKVNGERLQFQTENGYAILERLWKDGDSIELDLPMEARLFGAHPEIRSNAGKTAIERGPLVYCLEQIDNGAPLSSITIEPNTALTHSYDESLLGGAVILEGEGAKEDSNAWSTAPYMPLQSVTTPFRFRAVPYYLWGNRTPGEMSVWIRTKG
ncbi:glycoside hydrolase family 127 protein [Paenibacillus tarimensis]